MLYVRLAYLVTNLTRVDMWGQDQGGQSSSPGAMRHDSSSMEAKVRRDSGHPSWSSIVLQASGITGDNNMAGVAWRVGERGQ